MLPVSVHSETSSCYALAITNIANCFLPLDLGNFFDSERLSCKKICVFSHVETDRYFFETDTDIFKNISPIFGQLPIFDWLRIPKFQNLLTDILTSIFG